MVVLRRLLLAIALLLTLVVLVWAPIFDWMSPRNLEHALAGPRHKAARMVVVISIDGLAPRILAISDAPRLARLMTEGSVASLARTTLPSRTLPSHTSMLSGVEPDVHAVDWNRYQPWSEIRVPTVFAECADGDLECGLFAGKRKFAHFAENEPGVSRYVYGETAADVIEAASVYIRERDPDFVMVHLAEVDLAGHDDGWGSELQLREIAMLDALVGPFLREARNASQRPFVAIVTSDHGGHGTTHGSDLPDDVLIPWIAWGDGIPVGARIEAPISTVDTAATVLALLGRAIPPTWQGVARLP